MKNQACTKCLKAMVDDWSIEDILETAMDIERQMAEPPLEDPEEEAIFGLSKFSDPFEVMEKDLEADHYCPQCKEHFCTWCAVDHVFSGVHENISLSIEGGSLSAYSCCAE